MDDHLKVLLEMAEGAAYFKKHKLYPLICSILAGDIIPSEHDLDNIFDNIYGINIPQVASHLTVATPTLDYVVQTNTKLLHREMYVRLRRIVGPRMAIRGR